MKSEQHKKVLGLKLVDHEMQSRAWGEKHRKQRYAVGGSYRKKRTHGGPPQLCSADGFHFYQFASHKHKFSPASRDLCVVLAVEARDHARGDGKSVARELRVVKALGVGVRAVNLWCRLHVERTNPRNSEEWPRTAAAAFLRDPSRRRLEALRASGHPVDRRVVGVNVAVRLATVRQMHAAPTMPRRMNRVLVGVYHGAHGARARALARVDALHSK